MYQLIPLHSYDYLYEILIMVDLVTDRGNFQNKILTLNKKWNWSSYTKLTVSTIWTHGSVRSSKRNSVVMFYLVDFI